MDATAAPNPNCQAITIQAPLHVAILVADLERARRFYEGVLGLSPVDRQLRFPGVWYQVGNFQIHLMVADWWRASCPRPDKWGRNPHLAFAIADLQAAQATLEAAGYPLQLSSSGRAALFTQDPDGNIIELSEVVPT